MINIHNSVHSVHLVAINRVHSKSSHLCDGGNRRNKYMLPPQKKKSSHLVARCSSCLLRSLDLMNCIFDVDNVHVVDT